MNGTTLTWARQEPASINFTATAGDGTVWVLEITSNVNGKLVNLKKAGASVGSIQAPDTLFLKDLFGQVSGQL